MASHLSLSVLLTLRPGLTEGLLSESPPVIIAEGKSSGGGGVQTNNSVPQPETDVFKALSMSV